MQRLSMLRYVLPASLAFCCAACTMPEQKLPGKSGLVSIEIHGNTDPSDSFSIKTLVNGYPAVYEIENMSVLISSRGSNAEVTVVADDLETTLKQFVVGAHVVIRAGRHNDFTLLFAGEIRNQRLFSATKLIEDSVSVPRLEVSCEGEFVPTASEEFSDEPRISLIYGATLVEFDLHASDSSHVRGKISTVGIPFLQPGHSVELSGIGTPFEGVMYVREVQHLFKNDEYKTIFYVGH